MAVHADGKYPKWLQRALTNASESQEWNFFLGELQDTIHQQLGESHIEQFADLEDAERDLFFARGLKVLAGRESKQVMYSKLSKILDESLNDHISKLIKKDNPFQTRTDLLHNNSVEAAISILMRWPDAEIRSKLTRFLNQPFPIAMRHFAWRVCLSSERVLNQYNDVLQRNPRQAVSAQDKEISQRCEQFLNKEASFSDMKGSVGAFYSMKAVLSYYHAASHRADRLTDTDILLMAPLVQVLNARLSRRDPPNVKVMEVLVQEYFTLTAGRPGFMVETSDNDIQAFSQRVMKLVSRADPSAAQKFMDLFAATSNIDLVATESRMFEVLGNVMASLVRPIIRTFFVGILSMDALLFVWDQYLLGVDCPSYQDMFLAVAVASYLLLMKSSLLVAQNVTTYEHALRKDGIRLKAKDFQYVINQFFYTDLFRLLTQDQTTPVLDPTKRPTQDNSRDSGQWKQWYADLEEPTRTKPLDRQELRRQREEDRQARQELLMALREEETRRMQLEDKLRMLESGDGEEESGNGKKLKEQLMQERQKRVEEESRHRAEVTRLQLELERLRTSSSPRGMIGLHRPPTSATTSAPSPSDLYLLPPPPPSAATHASPMPEIHEMSEIHSLPPKEQAKEVLLTYLRKCSETLHTLGEGRVSQRVTLNEATRKMIVQHHKDMKSAEMELFGRLLKPGELEEMPESQNRLHSDKLMQIIVRKMNERRQAELDSEKKSKKQK